MKKIIVLLLSLLLMTFLLIWMSYGNVQAREIRCLCHNFINNPHEVCSDDDSYKKGHENHLKSGFDVYGKCPVPTATPTVTNTPMNTPTATPTVTNTPMNTPTVSPTMIPDPTATPTVTAGPTRIPEPTKKPEEPKKCNGESYYGPFCGWSPDVSPNTKYDAPVCSVALPEKPTFTYKRIDGSTVRIFWDLNDTNTTHYSFNYGYSKNDMPYGALNIPKEAKTFDIGQLSANAPIWVVMGRWNTGNCVIYSDAIDP